MARINTAELIHMMSEAAYRTDQVRQDPTVVNAAKRFAQDAGATVSSAGRLAAAVGSAWARASEGRPPLVPQAGSNLQPEVIPVR